MFCLHGMYGDGEMQTAKWGLMALRSLHMRCKTPRGWLVGNGEMHLCTDTEIGFS